MQEFEERVWACNGPLKVFTGLLKDNKSLDIQEEICRQLSTKRHEYVRVVTQL